MYFTKEDYEKISQWILNRSVKDSELPIAKPLVGAESISILQEGRNKTMRLYDFIEQVAKLRSPDFYNATSNSGRDKLSLKEAVALVPINQRKLGLVVTYRNEHCNWEIVQFSGTSVNQWDSLNYWNNIIYQALEEFVLYPDEEDITGIRDGNRTFLKFKDRDYDPKDFSGMGRVILRKNYVGTQACSIDDEDHYSNILTQDMINKENTVYIIQYDFNLDGANLSIPKGSTLWFQGGSLNNGTVYLQETPILGAFEFADMGNVKLFGKFNTGQIMTFSDDSYLAKNSCYFTRTDKQSSATPEQDPKQDREVFYCVSASAYQEERRQELRWWNGSEWVLMLDITDYNEIKSIISDLIDKHNAEMSACYQYFKSRCHVLEVRMGDAESRLGQHDTEITNINTRVDDIDSRITDIVNRVDNIESIINNIDETIQNQIENYFQEHVISGANSITVNGETFTPDSNGNITLPDYPEPTSVELKKLKFTGATTAEYDGTQEVTVNIPASGGGGIADKVAHKLIFDGAVSAEYDGSEEIRVTIPESSGGSSIIPPVSDLDLKALTVRMSDDTTLVNFDCKEPKTIKFDKINIKTFTSNKSSLPPEITSALNPIPVPYSADILDPSKENTIDLSRLYLGSQLLPIVLYSAHIYRSSSNDRIWRATTQSRHSFINSISLSQNDSVVQVKLQTASGVSMWVTSCNSSMTETVNKLASDVTGGRYRSTCISTQCGIATKTSSSATINVRAWGPSNGERDQVNSAHAAATGHLLGFNLVVIGYLTY